MVLSIERELIESGRSAWMVASYDHGIGHAKSTADSSVAYTAGAAVSVLPCQEKHARDEEVSSYIRTLEPGRSSESAMKDLISAYTNNLKQQSPCG